MDIIKIYFVVQNGSKESHQMLEAFEACKANKCTPTWVPEDEVAEKSLDKTDFVVFNKFEGAAFEFLKETKCARILGPQCLLICLNEGRKIPNYTWPMYNIAMYDIIVACSHVPKQIKAEIKEKVKLMGGCYTDDLLSGNTHLITDSVKSQKYLQAAESGLKLMLPQWVEAVWTASLKGNVHGNDDPFLKHKCPPLYNLTISATGIVNTSERDKMANLIKSNGGKFTGKMSVSTTDILLCVGNSATKSEKFKAACKSSHIKCLTLEWLNDSILKGYALPYDLYIVEKQTSTSTPKGPGCNPNFSTLSAICFTTAVERTTVDESVINSLKRKDRYDDTIQSQLDSINVKKAKQAGQYLDGCNIYVVGFESDQREKICKLLKTSGATRFDDMTDCITHVIVGDPNCFEVKLLRSKYNSCALVSVNWLLESIEKGHPANEEDYLISMTKIDSDLGSPLSQKGINLLKSNKVVTEVPQFTKPTTSVDIGQEESLVRQYLQGLNSAQRDTFTDGLSKDKETFSQTSTQSTTVDGIFAGQKFVITDFDAEQRTIIKQQIENERGTVLKTELEVTFDYIVAPTFTKTPLKTKNSPVVNDLWLAECIEEREISQIRYYHRPTVLKDAFPLENCVVTISGYTNYERNFLKNLIMELGGIAQEQFARIISEEKNILASTHLVSSEATSRKYAAAMRWKLPAVSKKWLLDCAKAGRLMPEDEYPVGKDEVSDEESEDDTFGRIVSQNHKIDFSDQPGETTWSKLLTPKENLQHDQSGLNSPKTPNVGVGGDKSFLTPINQNVQLPYAFGETPCTQVTPIHKLVEEFRKTTDILKTPESPPLQKCWYNVDTPETPLENCVSSEPDKSVRKQLQRWINKLPDFVPPKPRRQSTPLAELKRRLLDKIKTTDSGTPECSQISSQASVHDATKADVTDIENCNEKGRENTQAFNSALDEKFLQIEQMLTASASAKRKSTNFQTTIPSYGQAGGSEISNSQPFTVQWDYGTSEREIEPPAKLKIFMLSGVDPDVRQELAKKLENLGGIVSELQSTYDPNCTHLICPKPARNEKTLSCMASGKWILHTSYIEKSAEAGYFLDEEEYEYGNVKAVGNIKVELDKEMDARMQSIHYWRKEIQRRGYGAFHDVRAIIVASKKESLIKVLEAGGGTYINAKPPFDENIHATHCLIEPKAISDFTVFGILAKQGIYCVNILYISDFLHRTNRDVSDCILSNLTKYYKN